MTLLTRLEVAGLLRISVATVDRMIIDGRLRAIKSGSSHAAHVRIPEDAVAEYVREHTTETAAR
jgi:excisionase family DNA binding protein